MLGIRKLNTAEDVPRSSSKKGRSSDLIELRNLKLLIRYYYHSEVRRKRYEDVIDELSNEFFITPYTVTVTLMKQDKALAELVNTRPTLHALKKDCLPFVFNITEEEKEKYNSKYFSNG